ncbi:hypothetical protein GBA52_005456 [Prunus armeniaca]|nr:hypothetical protein GBA52_005456 [Prunus armeniaca]
MREATFCMYMQILMANFNSKSPILHHLQANQEDWVVNPWKSCSLIILSVNEYKLNEVFDILDRKPNCNSPGSACYDPRFIGGDGIVFYFHGKNNQQFSLVSDRNLQINGRFSGHRPADRTRDYTWIQALGMLFSSHSFSVEATKVGTWDNQIDHLQWPISPLGTFQKKMLKLREYQAGTVLLCPLKFP